MTYTKTIKISEFSEITEALLSMQESSYETKEPLLELIQLQTEAKQKKFWKYFDENTMYCQYDFCNKRKWKYELIGNFCSQEHRAKQFAHEYHLDMQELTGRVG